MSLYQDEIMDHYRNPRNFGCKNCESNASSHMHNPSCGDKIIIHANIKNDTVSDVCFEGFGCALSTASASLLTEFVKGKTISEIQQINAKQIISLLNIEVTTARLKCALLPLEAIQDAIDKNSKSK